ncbi:MAG: hypothetical protein V3S01_00930 [Dehalococcoidia bacterium]
MAAASLVLLAVLIAACGQIRGGDDGAGGVVIGVRTPTPTPITTLAPATPSPTPILAPLESPEHTSTAVCTFNDFPAAPELLQVLEPQPEAEVSAPLLVRGWGSSIGIDERGVAVGLVTADRTLVTVLEVPPLDREDMEPPEGLDDTEFSRPFVAEVPVKGLSEPTPFCLWVYLDTTEDGLPVDAIQMPVVVIP